MTVRKSLSQPEAYIVIGSRGRIPINEETTLVYPVVERLGQNNHCCAPCALRSQIVKNGRGFSQPASQGRLGLADLLVKVRGQPGHGLFLSGGLALTPRPDQFCYADACVPGLLTKPITKTGVVNTGSRAVSIAYRGYA